DAVGETIMEWTALPNPENPTNIFATNTVMKDFFDYQWTDSQEKILTNHVYVANPKIAKNQTLLQDLSGKVIWAAGSKTWYDLAKSGMWVTGCTDGLGFRTLFELMEQPLISSHISDVTILTHHTASRKWTERGFQAIGFYDLLAKNNETIIDSVKDADFIFWSSFSQFHHYHQYANETVTHACAAGETAESLLSLGIHPIIFPTLKAFELWRSTTQ
ncbi:MAG: hypothetical protein WBO36_05045, partial [Saprospiraceae bacterium]